MASPSPSSTLKFTCMILSVCLTLGLSLANRFLLDQAYNYKDMDPVVHEPNKNTNDEQLAAGYGMGIASGDEKDIGYGMGQAGGQSGTGIGYGVGQAGGQSGTAAGYGVGQAGGQFGTAAGYGVGQAGGQSGTATGYGVRQAGGQSGTAAGYDVGQAGGNTQCGEPMGVTGTGIGVGRGQGGGSGIGVGFGWGNATPVSGCNTGNCVHPTTESAKEMPKTNNITTQQ